MSELQPDNTDAILGGQNPAPLNAAVLGGVAGEKWRFAYDLAAELGLSHKLAYQLSQTHEIFSFETVTVNKRGEIATRTRKKAFHYTKKIGNDNTLDMVYIPAGNFIMGSPDGEYSRQHCEKPQHLVYVPAFHIGKYPITQEQYQAIMGHDLSFFEENGKLPIKNVFWDDAQEFCQKLSINASEKYQLPSEAQWEYACRAGTTTPFHFGETITPEIANIMEYIPNVPKRGCRSKTTMVENFPANQFGLYDMHGNVWEWCGDSWHENYHQAPLDGSTWIDKNNDNRVVRGGSWKNYSWACRSAYRNKRAVRGRYVSIGFRVVCVQNFSNEKV